MLLAPRRTQLLVRLAGVLRGAVTYHHASVCNREAQAAALSADLAS